MKVKFNWPGGFLESYVLIYFVWFGSLRMVMSGWSVHLTTLFPGQA